MGIKLLRSNIILCCARCAVAFVQAMCPEPIPTTLNYGFLRRAEILCRQHWSFDWSAIGMKSSALKSSLEATKLPHIVKVSGQPPDLQKKDFAGKSIFTLIGLYCNRQTLFRPFCAGCTSFDHQRLQARSIIVSTYQNPDVGIHSIQSL